MPSRAIGAVRATACLTVAHITALGLPRPLGAGSTLLDASLPAGGFFALNDVLDGALAVGVAAGHARLLEDVLRARGGGGDALDDVLDGGARLVHSLLGGLLTLSQGLHMLANPLDEALQRRPPPPPLGAAVYWAHEYLSHRLFVFATMALWLHAAVQASAQSFTADAAAAPASASSLDPLTAALALAHGVGFGVFSIATRTVPIAAPLALATVVVAAVAARRPSLACRYTGAAAGVVFALHAGWLVWHRGGLPTFDDLSGHDGHAAAPPVVGHVRAWAVPIGVSLGVAGVGGVLAVAAGPPRTRQKRSD